MPLSTQKKANITTNNNRLVFLLQRDGEKEKQRENLSYFEHRRHQAASLLDNKIGQGAKEMAAKAVGYRHAMDFLSRVC